MWLQFGVKIMTGQALKVRGISNTNATIVARKGTQRKRVGKRRMKHRPLKDVLEVPQKMEKF